MCIRDRHCLSKENAIILGSNIENNCNIQVFCTDTKEIAEMKGGNLLVMEADKARTDGVHIPIVVEQDELQDEIELQPGEDGNHQHPACNYEEEFKHDSNGGEKCKNSNTLTIAVDVHEEEGRRELPSLSLSLIHISEPTRPY